MGESDRALGVLWHRQAEHTYNGSLLLNSAGISEDNLCACQNEIKSR